MHEQSQSQLVTFDVITDETAAKHAWERMTGDGEIDDEWDFRYAFFKYIQGSLHFIAAYQGEELVGLLPLQFNPGIGPISDAHPFKNNFLEIFGGDDTDSNIILVKPGHDALIPQLFDRVSMPTVLSPLAKPYPYRQTVAHQYTVKYVVDLTGMTEFKDFLEKQFDGKSRSKLVQQLNRLKRNHSVVVEDAKTDDLEFLFAFNKQRFGEASSFRWDYRKQVFRDLKERYFHDAFVIRVDGEVRAASFALLYKGAYLGMNIGYDFAIRDLGKLAVCTQIERAIVMACNCYDTGKGEGGWKEQFHLTPMPQYWLTIPGEPFSG